MSYWNLIRWLGTIATILVIGATVVISTNGPIYYD